MTLSLNRYESKYRINNVLVSLETAIEQAGSDKVAHLLSEIQTSDDVTVRTNFQSVENRSRAYALMTASNMLKAGIIL